jgi:DNA-directed RNA polymerase specialized sigma24 family protein
MVYANETSEESLLRKLSTKQSMERLRKLLTPDEYGLLHEHFIEGKTVRELAPMLGIAAPSVTVKIHNIILKLQKKEEQILMS